MNLQHNTRWLMVCSFLFACQKMPDDTVERSSPDPTQNFVTALYKHIVKRSDTSESINTFFYDSTGRLVSIESENNDLKLWKDKVEIFYNKQQRPYKSVTTRLHNNNSSEELFTYTFVYDTVKNSVAEIASAPSGKVPPNNFGFQFDSRGRLVSDTFYISQTKQVSWYGNFSWDTDNNINQHIIHHTNNLGVQTTTTWSFTYDKQKNPFALPALGFNHFLAYYNNQSSLNANNTKTMTMEGKLLGSFLEYKYNNEGLPVSGLYLHHPYTTIPARHEFIYKQIPVIN